MIGTLQLGAKHFFVRGRGAWSTENTSNPRTPLALPFGACSGSFRSSDLALPHSNTHHTQDYPLAYSLHPLFFPSTLCYTLPDHAVFGRCCLCSRRLCQPGCGQPIPTPLRRSCVRPRSTTAATFQLKNDQAFFKECCHPLSKGGELSSDKCNASSNPTTPAAPQPTTSAYAAAASPASSNPETYSGGVATYYYQNGAAGSCGNYNSDDTPIVAVDSRTMDPSLCGKKVRVTNTNNGKSVVCTIADTCPTCNTATSLDLSTGAFNQIAKPEEGMVPIAWHFE
ncbi:rare lipoprotein A (RlpA)-like double-psi beta-barrel domain-containing protein [Rhizoctonia solani AG-1 IA]|uniref:Rare lipoprotein A (RlpA)-like double-psi beta-barrel domain-containing protein n=1 Tax=Thanatephorus cucumeris (strain AG1-IA) TaxID=983506 RepID=L8X2H5_THACA|nr:rare lipoprotein A (RlpA)-like double-psi beta-barrel domain-containing protein [Rhizoctonia solani AG-1 IA]